MKSLKLIITLFIVTIIVNSSYSQFGNLKEKLENITKKSESSSGSYDSQGITSDVHSKNQGKIIFSESPIAFKNENVSQFKTNFTFSEDICFRVYLDDSFLNKLSSRAKSEGIIEREFEEYGTYKTIFYLDEKQIHSSIRDHNGMSLKAKSEWTTFRGEYFLNSGGENSSGMQDFIDFTSKIENIISAGQHSIKVEIYPYIYVSGIDKNTEIMISEPAAVGSFNLNVSNPMVKSNHPVLCKTPKRGMNEIEIENKVKGTAKSMTITSSSWDIERNEYTGIPLRRNAYAQAGIVNEDGTCGFQEILISQEYNGSNYGKPSISEYVEFIPVPCSCIK